MEILKRNRHRLLRNHKRTLFAGWSNFGDGDPTRREDSIATNHSFFPASQTFRRAKVLAVRTIAAVAVRRHDET